MIQIMWRHARDPSPLRGRRRFTAASRRLEDTPMRVREKAASFVLIPVLVATQAAAQHTVRDSAGIRIVENTSPVTPRGRTFLTISPKPDLEIGSADGAASSLFSVVVGALAFDDGSIVVADAK